MQTIFISGNDTDVGKTRVHGQLAGTLASMGYRVQIVKLVETGMPHENSRGDADSALETAKKIAPDFGTYISAFRLARYTQPLAPTEAARRDGEIFSIADLKKKLRSLPPCDVRLIEGAGGLGVPVDDFGTDWADFAHDVADATLVVVENRLGAICQARFLSVFCAAKGVPAPHFWLNTIHPQSEGVLASNDLEIPKLGFPIVGKSSCGDIFDFEIFQYALDSLVGQVKKQGSSKNSTLSGVDISTSLRTRLSQELGAREADGCKRSLHAVPASAKFEDLSNNDYLRMAEDSAVRMGAIQAVGTWGASSSASPLITGYKKIHEELEKTLCEWLGFKCGLLWNTGYAANCSVLGTLPKPTDRIFADRLIHNSMIAGILKSGARLQRFRHNDTAHLRELLEKSASDGFAGTVFVAVESVYSMDGDVPDLAEIARLRNEFGFVLIVDEAHATGWFGASGGGKIEEMGLQKSVDVLVGTLGKSLGSGGAYTLFNDNILREYLLNFGQEFVFSTYFPPSNAGAALAAVERVKNFSADERSAMPKLSRKWRAELRKIVSAVADGDSPVVAIPIGDSIKTTAAAEALLSAGFRVGAIRPPTVPAGTARLRVSLHRLLTDDALEKFCSALKSALAK